MSSCNFSGCRSCNVSHVIQRGVTQYLEVLIAISFRGLAENDLRLKVDLRAFNDDLLKNGALPRTVLKTHIKEEMA